MLAFAVMGLSPKMRIKCCDNFKWSISIDFYCASTLNHAGFRVLSVEYEHASVGVKYTAPCNRSSLTVRDDEHGIYLPGLF